MKLFLVSVIAVLSVATGALVFAAHAPATRPTLTFTVTHGNRVYVCNRWVYRDGWIDRCVRVAGQALTA